MEAKVPPKPANRGLFSSSSPLHSPQFKGENDENKANERRMGEKGGRNEEVFELEGDIEDGGTHGERERAVLAGILVRKCMDRAKTRILCQAFTRVQKAYILSTSPVQLPRTPPKSAPPPPPPLPKPVQTSVAILASVLTHHQHTDKLTAFVSIRAMPQKPIKKIKAGLALLQKRFQSRNGPSAYNTLQNSKLSQLLLNEFSLSILSRVQNSLRAKLKAEAFVRIKFTNQNRIIEVIIRKLAFIANSKVRNNVKSMFFGWFNCVKREKKRETEKNERFLRGFLVLNRVNREFGPGKQRIQQWRLATVQFRRLKLRKIKAGLICYKLNALKKALKLHSWNKILYFSRFQTKKIAKTKKSVFYAFSPYKVVFPPEKATRNGAFSRFKVAIVPKSSPSLKIPRKTIPQASFLRYRVQT